MERGVLHIIKKKKKKRYRPNTKLAFFLDDRYLSSEDSQFVELVEEDLDDFQSQGLTLDKVLLFPPVNNYLRLLIHKTVENNPKLKSFSVGEGLSRQTVVCWQQTFVGKEEEDLMSTYRPPSMRGRGRARNRDPNSQSPTLRYNSASPTLVHGSPTTVPGSRANVDHSSPTNVPGSRSNVDQGGLDGSTGTWSHGRYKGMTESRHEVTGTHVKTQQKIDIDSPRTPAVSDRDLESDQSQERVKKPERSRNRRPDVQVYVPRGRRSQGRSSRSAYSPSVENDKASPQRPGFGRQTGQKQANPHTDSIPRAKTNQDREAKPKPNEMSANGFERGAMVADSKINSSQYSTTNCVDQSNTSSLSNESNLNLKTNYGKDSMEVDSPVSNFDQSVDKFEDSPADTPHQKHASKKIKVFDKRKHSDNDLTSVDIRNSPPHSHIHANNSNAAKKDTTAECQYGEPESYIKSFQQSDIDSAVSNLQQTTEMSTHNSKPETHVGVISKFATGEKDMVTKLTDDKIGDDLWNKDDSTECYIIPEPSDQGTSQQRKIVIQSQEQIRVEKSRTDMGIDTTIEVGNTGLSAINSDSQSCKHGFSESIVQVHDADLPIDDTYELNKKEINDRTKDMISSDLLQTEEVCEDNRKLELTKTNELNFDFEMINQENIVPDLDIDTAVKDSVSNSSTSCKEVDDLKDSVDNDKDETPLEIDDVEGAVKLETIVNDASDIGQCTTEIAEAASLISETEEDSILYETCDNESETKVEETIVDETAKRNISDGEDKHKIQYKHNIQVDKSKLDSILCDRMDMEIGHCLKVDLDQDKPVSNVLSVESTEESQLLVPVGEKCNSNSINETPQSENESTQSENDSDNQQEYENATSEVIPKDTDQSEVEEPDEDSWDAMFDDDGECLDPNAMEELTKIVGKVKIQKSKKINYLDFQPKDKAELDYTEYGHIIEIHGFPAEFTTRDLIMAFQAFMSRGFDLKWVDDTHALGIFSSSIAAQDALNMFHPLLKVSPLSAASKQSKVKARKCTEFLQPYKPRPETSASAARRLVAGALGLATNVSREKRDKERQQLREAKEKRRQDRKNREDIWEFGKCAMDEES